MESFGCANGRRTIAIICNQLAVISILQVAIFLIVVKLGQSSDWDNVTPLSTWWTQRLLDSDF